MLLYCLSNTIVIIIKLLYRNKQIVFPAIRQCVFVSAGCCETFSMGTLPASSIPDGTWLPIENSPNYEPLRCRLQGDALVSCWSPEVFFGWRLIMFWAKYYGRESQITVHFSVNLSCFPGHKVMLLMFALLATSHTSEHSTRRSTDFQVAW